MKAMVYDRYGSPDVLRLETVETPSPQAQQVLVKVHAASVTTSILYFIRGEPFLAIRPFSGLLRPKIKIPGADFAGQVAAVGSGVTRFKVGDAVFGDLSASGRACFAEYTCASENDLALKPANLSYTEAAAAPEAALVALQCLRDAGQIKPGHKVLICGASGGIGSYAVQLAKYFGAEVTGLCSTRNLEMVRSLGADHVIDYTQTDFAQTGQTYDLILATAGNRSIFDYRRALSPQGVYVASGGSLSQIFQALLVGPLLSRAGGQKLCSLNVKPNEGLEWIKELFEAGKIKPVIDRCYPFHAAAEAINYYAGGHARGKVIVTVE